MPAPLTTLRAVPQTSERATADSLPVSGCGVVTDGRDGRLRDSRPGIRAEDWDLLFRSVLDRLEQVAFERPWLDPAGQRHQAPGATLRECLDALDQLRRSVPDRS